MRKNDSNEGDEILSPSRFLYGKRTRDKNYPGNGRRTAG